MGFYRRSQQSSASASHTHTHTHTHTEVSFVLLCSWHFQMTHILKREIRKSVWGFILSLRSVFLSLAGLEDFKASATSCPPTTWLSCVTSARETETMPTTITTKSRTILNFTWPDDFLFLGMMDGDKVKCVASVHLLWLNLWGKYYTSPVNQASNAFLQSAIDLCYWHTLFFPQTMCSHTSPLQYSLFSTDLWIVVNIDKWRDLS